MNDSEMAELERLFEEWRRRRDRESFDRLLSCAYPPLHRIAHNCLRTTFFGPTAPADTTDVLHAGLLRLLQAFDAKGFFERAESFSQRADPPTINDFLRFAIRLIRHVVIDVLRKHDRVAFGALDAELADSTFNPERLAAWTDFHRAVDDLPEPVGDVFDRRFYLELSVAETARQLSISERTVKSRYADALVHLHPFAERIGRKD